MQCHGITKAGRRCSITASSSCRVDRTGQLAAGPLQRGGLHCLFHARPFCTYDEQALQFAASSPPVIVYVDLETTSLDVLSAEILEIGAVAEDSGAAFSSLVRPAHGALETSSTSVHGISAQELAEAPTFRSVWKRFAAFLERLAWPSHASRIGRRFDSSCFLLRDEGQRAEVCLVAHNGMGFDFPVLSSQCYREGISLNRLEAYKYCDSLELLRALSGPAEASEIMGGLPCLKLQCLQCDVAPGSLSRAHRALDDAQRLKSVVCRASARVGISVGKLVGQACRSINANASEVSLLHLTRRRLPGFEEVEDTPPCGAMLVRAAVSDSSPNCPQADSCSTAETVIDSSTSDDSQIAPASSGGIDLRPVQGCFDWRHLERKLSQRRIEPLSIARSAPTTPPRSGSQTTRQSCASDTSPQKTRVSQTSSRKRALHQTSDNPIDYGTVAGMSMNKRFC